MSKMKLMTILGNGRGYAIVRLIRFAGINRGDIFKTAHAVAVEDGYSLTEIKSETIQSDIVLIVQPVCGGVGPSGAQVKTYAVKLQKRFLELGLTSEFSVGVITRDSQVSCDDTVGGEIYLVSIRRKSF